MHPPTHTARRLSTTLVFLATSLWLSPSLAASDCPNTAWQNSNGGTCANLGLNSKKAICTGEQFATSCDDTRSQIRTCRSNFVCDISNSASAQKEFQWNNSGDRSWKNSPNWAHLGQQKEPSWQHDGNDFILFRGKRFHCTEWNYRQSRPCKSGHVNEDCQGRC